MKKFFIFLAGIVFFVMSAIALFYFQHLYNFSARIADNVCIGQVFMKDEYDLVNCDNKEVLVQEAMEWIVVDEIVYGISEDDRGRYFVVETSDNSVRLFRSFGEHSDYLNELGLPRYDMSRSENIAHLLYGGGRDRVFPTEEGCCLPWRR